MSDKAVQSASFVEVGLDDPSAYGAGHAERGNVARIDNEVGTSVVGVVSPEPEEQTHRSSGVSAAAVAGEDVVPHVDLMWPEPVAVSVVIDPSNDPASDQDQRRRSRLRFSWPEPALPLRVATGYQDLLLAWTRRT